MAAPKRPKGGRKGLLAKGSSHRHRASSLCSQKHKPFKRTAKRRAGGAAAKAAPGPAPAPALGRVARSLRARQLREQKHAELRSARRLGLAEGVPPPPRIVAIVPLHRDADAAGLKNALVRLCGGGDGAPTPAPGCLATVPLPAWAQLSRRADDRQPAISFVDAAPYRLAEEEGAEQPLRWSYAAALHVLDVLKVANVALLVAPAAASLENPPFDELGYETIRLMRHQGMPAVVGTAVSAANVAAKPAAQPAAQPAAAGPRFMAETAVAGPQFAAAPATAAALSAADFPPAKLASAAAKLIGRFFTSEFTDEARFVPVAGSGREGLAPLVRALAAAEAREFPWRGLTRGFAVLEDVRLAPDGNAVELTGMWRGVGVSVHHPVHVTGVGDFVVEAVEVADDARGAGRESASGAGGDSAGGAVRGAGAGSDATAGGAGSAATAGSVFRLVDRTNAEVLASIAATWDRLAPESALGTDQAVIGDEPGDLGDAGLLADFDDDGPAAPDRRRTAKSGRGGGRRGNSDIGGDSDFGVSDFGADRDIGGADGEGDSRHSFSDDSGEEFGPETASSMADATSGRDGSVPYCTLADLAAAKKLQFESRRPEDMDLPDEVDTPLDQPARTRFAKYRALRNFRTSEWDPYEELPADFARLFEFASFSSSAAAAHVSFAASCEAVAGQVVRLRCLLAGPSGAADDPETRARVAALDARVAETRRRAAAGLPTTPLLVSTLFPYERRVAVRAFNFARTADGTARVKSKTPQLVLQAGFRRYAISPLFCEPAASAVDGAAPKLGNVNKLKFERFFEPGTVATAVCCCPVVIPPANVLLLDPETAERAEEGAAGAAAAPAAAAPAASGSAPPPPSVLLASGGVAGKIDPRWPVVKRIVLSGYPFRVHKKKAVVRFMFFSADDVRWYKPAELRTRSGLRGHIKEALGTHGYMKCIFNDFVKHSDIVALNLYKRVFPKFDPSQWCSPVE